MKDKNLQDLGKKLVKYGIEKGADEVNISINDGSQFSVSVRNGQIESLEEAGNKSLSITVIKDKKRATAASSDFEIGTLENLVAGAVERSAYGSKDEFLGLPEFKKIKVKEDDLKIFDPEILKLPPEKKIEIAKKVESIALKMDKRISNSFGSSFSSGYGTRYLFNSKGFTGSYTSTGCSFGVYLQAGPTDNSVSDGWSSSKVYFKDLDDVEAVAKKAVERTVRQLNPQKVKTQNVPVVVEPGQARQLIGFLIQCIMGSAVYQGRTFLEKKLNQKIASANVNITDDGLLPGKQNTIPFDSEGVPVRKVEIVQEGMLKSYLLDTYAARKLKLNSTGHSGGAHNLYLKNGKHTPEEIIKSVKKGLFLTLTMGQGTNAITGDISKGAAGLWIENGEIVHAVSEITISGNLGEILNNIVMIGNDLELKGSINSPTFKIGELTVGGK